ncbi:MAG: hypothetical protein FWG91_00215 [Lachnospiraceae bacterium]|nr:hypothetical protein [Lachnospiraceae bacterium]
MTYLTLIIHKIDYSILLKELKTGSKKSPVSTGTSFCDKMRDTMMELMTPLFSFLESLSLTRNIIARKINKSAMNYGIVLSTYLEKNEVYYEKLKEGNKNCMLTLSASIEKIDYQKLINELKKTSASPNNKPILLDIINIIEPFLSATMKTIPNSAIAELFMLLGQDKMMDLAEDYGIHLADLNLSA